MRKRIEPLAKTVKRAAEKKGGGRTVESGISDDSLVGNRPVNFNGARPAPAPPWATPRDGRSKPTKVSKQTGVGVPAPLD